MSATLQRQHQAEDRAALQHAWNQAARRLANQLPAEPTRPFDDLLPSRNTVDYRALVAERCRHETPRAARCVRTGSKHQDSSKALRDGTISTEYTPIERININKLSSTPQPASQTPQPSTGLSGAAEKGADDEKEGAKDTGPDPNTLPPARAPPSHPSVKLNEIGVLDGHSILEYDLNALTEKPWRRSGSDLSDWFNYGFDEITWQMYCSQRQNMVEHAGMLKTNVLVRIRSASHARLAWTHILAVVSRHRAELLWPV